MSLEFPAFDRFQAIYPPRPEGAINPKTLDRYSGFIAQYKYDDFRALAYLFPDGRVELYNRYRKPLTYSMPAAMRTAFHQLKLPKRHFHVLDGGLMVRSGKVRDRFVLWDILVYKSRYLIGSTYAQRYRLLTKLVGAPTQWEAETGRSIALKINSHLWLAPIFTEDFPERFAEAAEMPELEGLVLKNPHGKLQRAIGEKNNGEWMIRVRRPGTHYTF